MTANVRLPRPTGAISRSACGVRARTNSSRPQSCPVEDEKFAYVALTRAAAEQRPARVLAQQPVCHQGRGDRQALHDQRTFAAQRSAVATKASYSASGRWRWGDAIFDADRQLRRNKSYVATALSK